MTSAPEDWAARPKRLAILIDDPVMRSSVTAALVLGGVDIQIARSLAGVRGGTPVVTDRAPGGDTTGERPGALSAVAIAHDPAGRASIGMRVPIVGTDVRAIFRAANGLSAGDGTSLG